MKAGSLLDDNAVHFARVTGVAILRRSVPRSVLAPHAGCPRGDPALRGTFLSAFIYFFNTTNETESRVMSLESPVQIPECCGGAFDS